MREEKQPGAWLLEVLQQGGVDIPQLETLLPGETHQALTSPESLTPDQVNRILLRCADLSGDANFGLRMVELVNEKHLGPYGFLLLNAPTVGDTLRIAARYYRMFYRGGALTFTEKDRKATLVYRVLTPPTVSARHDNEWTLAFFVELIRKKSAHHNWLPRRTNFTHRGPEDLAEHHRYFGDDCFFDQARDEIEFSSDILNARDRNTDGDLLRVLTEYADSLLTKVLEDDDFEAHARMLILQNLEHGPSSASTVADAMNMSLSTLKRRLRKHNLRFRELRDNIVRDVAQQALAHSSVPIGNIALRVGYSETSAFDRAFSRLCGITPSKFRERASTGRGVGD